MAETQIENQVCNACGADIRPNALFCYSCGDLVTPQVVTTLEDPKNVSDVWLQEGLEVEKNNGKPVKIEQPITEQTADKPILKSKANEEPKLKSAAAMRRKAKVYQPKKIEVVWEEHNNAPNIWFIAAAIILTLLAAGILYLAIYLK